MRSMKLCFLPIDNRPVCEDFPRKIVACDSDVEIFLPPCSYLGDLNSYADVEKIYDWVQSLPHVDCMILSLDTIAYGGLVASRRRPESFEYIKSNLEKFKMLFKEKADKVYAFSSVMRISNNNINIEEKEYWSKYGKKIFDYSYHTSKAGKWGMESCVAKLIPDEILNDYMATRRRNFEINKLYLEWKKEGVFDLLIFSKDDCAEYGFNVDEAKELQRLGGDVITGADEIPLTLLARAVQKPLSICPIFTEDTSKDLISKYEDISVENSVIRQIQLAGFDLSSRNESDIILVVNNFKTEQGEIVMKVDTEPFAGRIQDFLPQDKPYAIADVRFANGSDNVFVEKLFANGRDKNFLAYAAWNTTANTVGSLLCMIKYILAAKNTDKKAVEQLLAIRFLDDWAYQANVRQKISAPIDISEKMSEYVNAVEKFLGSKIEEYSFGYPWNRLFETEVTLKMEEKVEFSRDNSISSSALN